MHTLISLHDVVQSHSTNSIFSHRSKVSSLDFFGEPFISNVILREKIVEQKTQYTDSLVHACKF